VAACNRAMGSGCGLRVSGTNSTIVVLRTPNNDLIYGWGLNRQEAEKEARTDCKKLSVACTAYRSFTAKPWQKRIGGNEPDRIKTYFPDPAKVIPHVAVVAWPSKEPTDKQWLGKSWLSSGIKGGSNAKAQAVHQCTKDSGTQCSVGAVSMGGALALFSTNRDSINHWLAIPSSKDAKRELQEFCKAKLKRAQCTLVNAYDAQTRRMIVVDDRPTAR
jgi:hypothetical protein